MEDASIDAVVTDPPYELGFMGKAWDAAGVAYSGDLWAEVLRVLKPGGHLLAFGGTRTYHRMTVAIEDAGFEVRDSIHWVYGSGFPKSHNVSKAIHKADTGSAAAAEWEGWGTALKPAHEPIVVARKPLQGTVAANVLEHGTGALNIDGCRVAGALEGDPNRFAKTDGGAFAAFSDQPPQVRAEGRWPANFVLTHAPDCEQVGTTTERVGGGANATSGFVEGYERGDGFVGRDVSAAVWRCAPGCPVAALDEQSGDGASRYFTITEWDDIADAVPFRYQAKASKKERNAGVEAVEPRFAPTMGDGIGGKEHNSETATKKQNFHPTVKPLDLMRWLARLITPPHCTILDPFAGSGTTMIAAILEGFHPTGIELTDDYMPIIQGRCQWATQQTDPDHTTPTNGNTPTPETTPQPKPPTLFD
jgi:site-specific DNA-methyltransferase (adenine-specific)